MKIYEIKLLLCRKKLDSNELSGNEMKLEVK